MSLLEKAKYYYPTLWSKERILNLQQLGLLTEEEVTNILNESSTSQSVEDKEQSCYETAN